LGGLRSAESLKVRPTAEGGLGVVDWRRVVARGVSFAHAPWSAFWLLTAVVLIADVVRLVMADGIPKGLGVAPASIAALTLFLQRVLPRGPT
jgi:hypothetical protein